MTDTEIRDRLERLGDRVEVAPDAFERLARRRVRAERRRRVATAVLAFVIAIGGTAGLVTAFRGERSPVAGSETPSLETKSRVYRDPLGWEIEVPEGWHVLRTKGLDGGTTVRATVIGTPILKSSPSDLGGTGPDLSVFGRHDVGLVVWRDEGAPTIAGHPDSSFPLRLEDFKAIPGDLPLTLGQKFWVGGRKFRLQAGGFASAPPERFELLRATVDSLRPITPPAGELDALPGTRWILIQIDGTQVPETSPRGPASLEFTDRRLSGSDGCNEYGARYWLEGDRLHVGGLFQTLVLCSGDIGSRANGFNARLRADGRLSLDGDILTMVSSEGTLTFRRT
jgi:heat shock protein HslJ